MATRTPKAGECRRGLAMGNAVAPVVHLVVDHHRDFHCAAVMHLVVQSGGEMGRSSEVLELVAGWIGTMQQVRLTMRKKKAHRQ